MRNRVFTVLLLLVGAVTLSGGAAAQTPTAVCALDSLRLISPADIALEYDFEGRPGVKIRWQEVASALSTCHAAVDTSGLGVDFAIDGIYADLFDREISMSCLYGGEVGSETANSVLLTWSNINQVTTGRVNGSINLSNNGGVLGFNDGAWSQKNEGLLSFLPQTDIVALAESPVDGAMLAHLRGVTSRGLWYLSGPEGGWTRIGGDDFEDGVISTVGISSIVFSPHDAGTFAVGTISGGVLISRDGGQSFTRYQSEFADEGSWNQREVTAMSWVAEDRLFVAIAELGLFRSTDGGVTYDLVETLLVPEEFPAGGQSVAPKINDIVDDGLGGLIVGVNRFGMYKSQNDGLAWQWLWSNLLSPGAVPVDVLDVQVSPQDEARLFAGARSAGIWWTPNNGSNWYQLGASLDWPDEDTYSTVNSIVVDETGSRYLAAADGFSILSCALGDTAWQVADIPQPSISNYNTLLRSGAEHTDFWLGTYGGGIYRPGSQIRLSDTIKDTQTDIEYRDLDLGIMVSFGEGELSEATQFRLILQSFQGYAVWRSDVTDPDDMELIGLYDRTNPETCIEGYCGDESYNVLPNCYAEKQAACFDFSVPDSVEFFDGDVYEGFTYYYAVTTFDYGNAATTDPNSLVADQLFATRFAGDELSQFGGEGNRIQFYVHKATADPVDGPEIYAYPNPLRVASGFSGAEGVDVKFKNLPPESRIRIFTLDGDLVADLGPEYQVGDIMTWSTTNGTEQLSSGVYIYKVDMPEREAFYGKVVIIR